MVNKCCVQGCKSKGGQQIKFHRFPNGDIGDKWISFLKLYSPSFVKTISSNICGLHFDQDLDYEISNTSVFKSIVLKKNAVPSIINPTTRRSLFNESNVVSDENEEEEIVTISLSDLYSEPLLTPVPTISTSVVVNNNSDVVSSWSVPQSSDMVISPTLLQSKIRGKDTDKEISTSSQKRKCFMGDFKSLDDIDSPNSRLKYRIASQKTTKDQRKRIKYLHKQTVDLKKRIKTLEDLVNHLNEDKKLIR